MASVTKSPHDYEEQRQKWGKSVCSKPSALNANAPPSRLPVTLVQRKKGGFVISLAPKWSKSQLAGALNMTKGIARQSVLEFFYSNVAHSRFSCKPERKWENSFLFLFFAINLNHITLGLIFLLQKERLTESTCARWRKTKGNESWICFFKTASFRAKVHGQPREHTVYRETAPGSAWG